MAQMSSTRTSDVSSETSHFKIIVVGAGPHALAAVTRLLEPLPDSLHNEDEHQRLVMHRHARQSGRPATGATSSTTTTPSSTLLNASDIAVIDPSGTWLQRWDAQFRAFDIPQLRSPSFFHPDPADGDALRTFAVRNGRGEELHETAADLFDKRHAVKARK